MKIHSTYLHFSFMAAAAMPLPSHAEVQIPYWLQPEWIQTKIMDFHARNTERFEQAQAQAQARNNPGNTAPAITVNNEKAQRKSNLAPVETATAKVNEKHLTKEELQELRKQLRDKQ